MAPTVRLNWERKRKGCADIYTAPGIDRAVVDRRGFGLPPFITYDGKPYDTVQDAMRAAECEVS